jgi:Arc/MetJ family transcription regulator
MKLLYPPILDISDGVEKRYIVALRKTTLAIDDELIRQAAQVLGTHGIKQTVDAALHEAIERREREKFIARITSMDGLDLDDKDVMAGAWRD